MSYFKTLKIHSCIYMAAFVVWLPNAVNAAVSVDFTLALNNNHDSGLSYTSLKQAGDGTSDAFVVGFQIEITGINGEAVDIAPVAAFCAELAEPIAATSYTFKLGSLRTLSAGTAGQPETASSNIPSGGIGALRAARLAYLFDEFYISDVLTVWEMTDANPSLHAFQLAVWEITHDDGLSLFDTNSEIWLPEQTGGSLPTRRENARQLAQQYLDSVAQAEASGIITSGYQSDKFDFYALTSTTGNDENGAGFQDVILAVDKNIAIPEPGAAALLAGFSALIALVTRRRR
ncbi:MAG: hypothetical protein EA353_08290 [Puniceicoccaceae bacterium]|nr:MAG: hypothetical protein EA353_08290 [Puniceicoccaceae bacterium]